MKQLYEEAHEERAALKIKLTASQQEIEKLKALSMGQAVKLLEIPKLRSQLKLSKQNECDDLEDCATSKVVLKLANNELRQKLAAAQAGIKESELGEFMQWYIKERTYAVFDSKFFHDKRGTERTNKQIIEHFRTSQNQQGEGKQ